MIPEPLKNKSWDALLRQHGFTSRYAQESTEIYKKTDVASAVEFLKEEINTLVTFQETIAGRRDKNQMQQGEYYTRIGIIIGLKSCFEKIDEAFPDIRRTK